MSQDGGNPRSQPLHHHPAFLPTLLVVGGGAFFLGSSMAGRGDSPSNAPASAACCGHHHGAGVEHPGRATDPGQAGEVPPVPVRFTFEFPGAIVPEVQVPLVLASSDSGPAEGPAPVPSTPIAEPEGSAIAARDPAQPPPAIHPSILSSASPMPGEGPDSAVEVEPAEAGGGAPPGAEIPAPRLADPPAMIEPPAIPGPQPGPVDASPPTRETSPLPSPDDPGSATSRPFLDDQAPAPPRASALDLSLSPEETPRSAARGERGPAPIPDPRPTIAPRPPLDVSPIVPVVPSPPRPIPRDGHGTDPGPSASVPGRIPAADQLDGAIGEAMARMVDDLIRPHDAPPPVSPAGPPAGLPGRPRDGLGIAEPAGRPGGPGAPGLIREWSRDEDHRGRAGDRSIFRAGGLFR